MYHNHKQVEQQDNHGQLPLSCQVLVACLTGSNGRVPMPDFFRIWKQMLPESRLSQSLPAGRRQLSAPAAFVSEADDHRTSPRFMTAKIREGPD